MVLYLSTSFVVLVKPLCYRKIILLMKPINGEHINQYDNAVCDLMVSCSSIFIELNVDHLERIARAKSLQMFKQLLIPKVQLSKHFIQKTSIRVCKIITDILEAFFVFADLRYSLLISIISSQIALFVLFVYLLTFVLS